MGLVGQHENSRENVIELSIVADTAVKIVSLHPHPVTRRHMNGDARGTRKSTVLVFTAEAADDVSILVEVQVEEGSIVRVEASVEGVEAGVRCGVDAGCGVIASSHLVAYVELDRCMARDWIRFDESDSVKRGSASWRQ